MKTAYCLGCCLLLSAAGYANSFTRDSGDTSWSNLGQWNYYDGSAYVDSPMFPASGDTILLNGGKSLSVDTNAAVSTIRLPNTDSDASLEFSTVGKTLTVSTLNVGRSGYTANGTVTHSAGTLDAAKLSLQSGGDKTASYLLSGGAVSADVLEVGNSSVGTTGTALFVQSGGTVESPDISVGGSGAGTYQLSGGSLTASGTFEVLTNGLLKTVGTAGAASLAALEVQPGGALAFVLDADGIGAVQVSGSVDLSDASLSVDGSAYWGDAADFVLLTAGPLSAMPAAGNISITGLESASVSQAGNSLVLSVAESKETAVFENTTGDGLWNTAGNWTPSGVPTGAVIAVVGEGQSVTAAAEPPEVDGIIVRSNAMLTVQDGLSTTKLQLQASVVLLLELGLTSFSPVTVSEAEFDDSCSIEIDGSGYEGIDGYFAVISSSNLVSSLTNQVSLSGFGERAPAVIVEDDGLWLRLIAMPSLSERLCSLVPDSRAAADYAGTTFSATREYDPSGSAWSVSFDEAHVLDTTLIQTAAHTNQSWELRTGRGGFIYSLRTGGLGETVPPSWRSTQDASVWNDEVWQGVAVGPLNDPSNGSPYFMHQSGVYMRDPDVLSKPFYSPQVASYLDMADRSFTTVNWTPQAHINIYTDDNPTNNWKSYLLCYTRYKDLGQGVIEVTMGYYNYGPDLLDWFNMPWGGVRRTSTEYAFTSEPGGTTWRAPITNSWGTSEDFDETGGWQGYSNTSNGATPALAFVFGEDTDPLLENQKSDSWFRTGYAGTKDSYQSTETDWRNYLVSTAVRRYNLYQGNGIWSTHFYVLGDDLQDLSDRIQDRGLIGADLAAFDYTEADTPLVAYRISGSGAGFQCVEDGGDPDFFLYAHPVSSSFPVFEVIEDGVRYLTWNPYANGMVKPYDGTMGGLRLLGFAMPASGTNGTYAALDGLLPSENYWPDGETLFVRTATTIETWRVEYFGFTDDADDGADTADPDGDDLANLGEYALGGNPTNSADAGYVPTAGLLEADGTNWFEVVHARRKDADLSYTLESTDNLVSNGWTTAGYVELPDTGTLDDDFEAVTNRIDTAGKTNEFIRLKIDQL